MVTDLLFSMNKCRLCRLGCSGPAGVPVCTKCRSESKRRKLEDKKDQQHIRNTYIESVSVDVVLVPDEFLQHFHAAHSWTLEVPLH